MSKPLTYQTVARARDFIKDEATWVRGLEAVSVNRRAVRPHDPRAVRFCAFGALMRASHELVSDPRRARQLAYATKCSLETLIEGPEYLHLENINDDEGHAAVINLFDRYLAM